ncbi:MAG TPA: site-2 protease family protein [Methylomirabilota bacterium]|nr:site-2 protease family protein [Methylomirabilota bacterium]
MDVAPLLNGLLWFAAFLFSTTVHEAMHALVAYRGGDATAYLGGQVSLSPVPHIRREPIGMLLVPLLTAFTAGWSVGWASTPYDPRWAARHPRRAAAMAAAGPAGNLAIALLAFAALRAGLALDVFVAPDRVSFHHLVEAAGRSAALTAVGDLLTVLLVLNVLLFVFNMLPVPPLDGATAVTGILPERAARLVRALNGNPAVSMLGLLVAWQLFPEFARPLFAALLRLVHPGDFYF